MVFRFCKIIYITFVSKLWKIELLLVYIVLIFEKIFFDRFIEKAFIKGFLFNLI